MAAISKLKPGMIVWSIVKQKMGRTAVSYNALFEVQIIEVDPEGNWVTARWNGNPPQKFYKNAFSKWKINKPEPKNKILGANSY